MLNKVDRYDIPIILNMADLQIHANLAIAAAAVFIPVCSATVALRVYARHLKKVGLGADDYLIMAALVR